MNSNKIHAPRLISNNYENDMIEISDLGDKSFYDFIILRKNKLSEITGVLCSGEGIFLQVLEGERSAVNKLYVTICKDQRHTDIELLHYEEIKDRVFYAWSMDYIPISTLYEMIKIQNPDFDPYLSSGKLALNCVIDYLRLNDEPKEIDRVQ